MTPFKINSYYLKYAITVSTISNDGLVNAPTNSGDN